MIIAQALRKDESGSLADSSDGGGGDHRRSSGFPMQSITSDMGDSIDPNENYEIEILRQEICFEKADKGLGLSIAGGRESTPYKLDDNGIFISRVTPNGPAGK